MTADSDLVPDDAGPLVDDELPVVARLVVEVRSDGTRTVARGAVEDMASGQRVAVEARADSVWALGRSLAGALLRGPALTSRALGPTEYARTNEGRVAGRLRRLRRRLRRS